MDKIYTRNRPIGYSSFNNTAIFKYFNGMATHRNSSGTLSKFGVNACLNTLTVPISVCDRGKIVPELNQLPRHEDV